MKLIKKGTKSDWSRPRRRLLGAHKLYFPKTKDYVARFIAAIDTSGSMSDDDIRFAVSQLQALTKKDCEGVVIPMDVKVYWDLATDINSTEDLKSVKMAGGGGTVFEELFEEVWKHFDYNDYDLIIVITDGYVETNRLKNPKKEVVWVIASRMANEQFDAPFGKSVVLR
jgi:predicted metal-dependent peptidase